MRTGQITFGLASSFHESWAVEQAAEAVKFGRAKALTLGIHNVPQCAGWSRVGILRFSGATRRGTAATSGKEQRDLRSRLLDVAPEGTFREEIDFSYTLASKP